MNENKHKWIGITGTWRRTNNEVEQDVRSAVREIITRGDGVVVGGALGVDYFALNEAIRVNPDAARIKVVLPSSLKDYIAHLQMWASGYDTGDPAITSEEAERLANQLRGLEKINQGSIVESSTETGDKINKDVYFTRNSIVVELSNEVIAFQVNDSAGTQDTINKARGAGKNVIVHSYSITK
ncbi:MAG TPA: DNA-processing protein DprA [Candidatus Paceibacterota bacterium]